MRSPFHVQANRQHTSTTPGSSRTRRTAVATSPWYSTRPVNVRLAIRTAARTATVTFAGDPDRPDLVATLSTLDSQTPTSAEADQYAVITGVRPARRHVAADILHAAAWCPGVELRPLVRTPAEHQGSREFVVLTVDDGRLDRVRAGAVVQATSLAAVASGLIVYPAVNLGRVPEFRAGLIERLTLAGYPQVLLRIDPGRRPWWSSDIHNSLGEAVPLGRSCRRPTSAGDTGLGPGPTEPGCSGWRRGNAARPPRGESEDWGVGPARRGRSAPVPSRGRRHDLVVPTMVLLRHGQSTANATGEFTGWVDVPLTDYGEQQARDAGELLWSAGFRPDVVHTSVFGRAIRTADLVLDVLGRSWVPVRRTWRLGERQYGAWTGRRKADVLAEVGDEQFLWRRRSLHGAPPPLAPLSLAALRADPRFADLPADTIPPVESLADVVARIVPYWIDVLAADLRAGRLPLVVAHGNSLRALVTHWDRLSEDEVMDLNIPTGIPLRYDFDSDLRPMRRCGQYLDPDAAAEASAAVAREGQEHRIEDRVSLTTRPR